MGKRKIIFGQYDTALEGWTLASWVLEAAQHKTYYVEVAGRDGDIDLSTALTDGEPKYGNRTLTVTLERSDESRLAREARIDNIINVLDGRKEKIYLPDDAMHYLIGRLHIQKDYNDPAHAAVTITAICDPWRYAGTEKLITLTAITEEQSYDLENEGRMPVIPVITVSNGTIDLTCGTESWSLEAGIYQLPSLQLIGYKTKTVTYSGSGKLEIEYREAIL